jgi:hypothetical protein
LRYCATSRKVEVSIPDGVIGIFYSHSPSGRTMALALAQPLTATSNRNMSWGWRWQVLEIKSLTTVMCRLSWNLGASAPGPIRVCPMFAVFLSITLQHVRLDRVAGKGSTVWDCDPILGTGSIKIRCRSHRHSSPMNTAASFVFRRMQSSHRIELFFV